MGFRGRFTNSHSHRTQEEFKEIASGLVGLLVLILVGIGVWVWWSGFSLFEIVVAYTYEVSPSAVSVDAEPTDCDFMHAPLGSKDCHYESRVTAYNADGAVVSENHAPKHRHDNKTGSPIISWDGGKTWSGDNLKASRVWVTWTKVQD
jgi:hypothetical protein